MLLRMAVSIACLGWGSLLWQPALETGAPLVSEGVRAGLVARGGSWHVDGPALPLELARHSFDTATRSPYLAWVIVPGVARSPVLWARLALAGPSGASVAVALDRAVVALAQREEAATRDIGRWPSEVATDWPCADDIAAWARARGFDGVVWTALAPLWQAAATPPSVDEACAWCAERAARGEAQHARSYVGRTARQIDSPIRRALAQRLGWGPLGD